MTEKSGSPEAGSSQAEPATGPILPPDGLPNGRRGNAWPVVAFSFFVLALVAFGWPSVRRGETDFLSFYAGARLAFGPHLYSVQHAHQIQRELANPAEVRAYIRPPFYAALLRPLAGLPYRKALLVWQAVNLAALAGFVWFWSPHALSAVISCWYFPIWINFAVGQDMPLVLFVLAFAAWLLRRNAGLTAGLVLSLCAAKFQLFVLLPLLIVAHRLWRVGLGLVAGAGVLLAVSRGAGGANWISGYFQMLEMNERFQGLHVSHHHMPNLIGLFYTIPYSWLWVSVLSLAVIGGTWYVVRRSPVEYGLAFLVCGSLLIGFHSFLYDCAILLPLFLRLPDTERGPKGLTLSVVIGSAALTLTVPSISYIGQLAILSLFAWLVREKYQELRRSAAKMPATA